MKYLNYEAIGRFLYDIILSPLSEENNYILGVKDNKLVKTLSNYLIVQDGDINIDVYGDAVTVKVESNTNWVVE